MSAAERMSKASSAEQVTFHFFFTDRFRLNKKGAGILETEFANFRKEVLGKTKPCNRKGFKAALDRCARDKDDMALWREKEENGWIYIF